MTSKLKIVVIITIVVFSSSIVIFSTPVFAEVRQTQVQVVSEEKLILGKVKSISDNTITIQSKTSTNKYNLDSQTTFQNGTKAVPSSEIKKGDIVQITMNQNGVKKITLLDIQKI